MDNILELLKETPDAVLILNKFQDYLREESLKRNEFLAMVHENLKAEFINGQIVLHSPVRLAHLRVSSRLSNQLMNFVESHHLGFIGIEKMMIALSRNYYEPDIVYYRQEIAQHVTDDQKLFPAPDLVVEILSESTKKVDYGIKFRDYAAHGVGEYWIVDVEQTQIEQYVLLDEKFELQARLNGQDVLTSLVIPKLTIHLPKIFAE